MVAYRRRSTSSRRRWTAALSIVAAAFGAIATRAYSHPLHTTLSEISIASDGQLQIVLRAFVDDFSAAVTGHAGSMPAPVGTPSDSATARYLARAVSLRDASGRGVAFTFAGVRRRGDVVWVTLRATVTSGGVGACLTNRVLFERYDDQVNIVQTSIAGRRRTLLFTNRDGATAKAL